MTMRYAVVGGGLWINSDLLGFFNVYLNLSTQMFLPFAPQKCSCHGLESELHP